MKQRNIRKLAVVSVLAVLLSLFPITAKPQQVLAGDTHAGKMYIEGIGELDVL